MDDVATLDNITESEIEKTPRNRQSIHSWGIKFGYLFPYGNNSYTRTDYNYPNASESFEQILTTDWVNWYELPADLALEWDIHVGWMAEVGTHFTLIKLLSRRDISPFLGAGVGIDYVFPGNSESDLRNGGFSGIGKAGVLFFRTYDFRLYTDVGYKLVGTSDLDQGPFAEFGILWQNGRRHYNDERSPLGSVLSVIGGLTLGIIVLGIVAN